MGILSSSPQWLAQFLDPYGRNRSPAENPNAVPAGQFFAPGQYAAPTYADDIQTAGAPRTPLEWAVAPSGTVAPESPGMGGPLSPARNIIPDAPQQGPTQAEQEAARARAAIAAAQARRHEPIMNPNMDSQWRNDRVNLDRAQDQYSADAAENQRRQGVSFADWWRFGGRQSDEWTSDQPAYRFTRLPDEDQPPRRGLLSARR